MSPSSTKQFGASLWFRSLSIAALSRPLIQEGRLVQMAGLSEAGGMQLWTRSFVNLCRCDVRG
jgi:hypothetical protein